jgi:hypothetical protein
VPKTKVIMWTSLKTKNAVEAAIPTETPAARIERKAGTGVLKKYKKRQNKFRKTKKEVKILGKNNPGLVENPGREVTLVYLLDSFHVRLFNDDFKRLCKETVVA